MVSLTSGTASSRYGFTGEQQDSYVKLIYLRSRYLSPDTGRFLTRDTWQGDYNRPLSLNHWGYVEGNPVIYTDPTGQIKEGGEAKEADEIVNRLKRFNINVVVDWGNLPLHGNPYEGTAGWINTCGWAEGTWKIEELRDVENSVMVINIGIRYLGGNPTTLFGPVTVNRLGDPRSGAPESTINLREDITDPIRRPMIIIHEMGHVLTHYNPNALKFFVKELDTNCLNGFWSNYCFDDKNYGDYDPGPYAGQDPQTGMYKQLPDGYARAGNWEDFAETFTVVVSEAYIRSGDKAYIKTAKLVYEQPVYNHDIGRRRKVMKTILSNKWR